MDLLSPSNPAAALPASSFDGAPLFTINDLLWFLYLYPLRVFSSFAPRGLMVLISRLVEPLVQFRARERREMVMRRMLAAPGAGITQDQAPRIARQFIANSAFRMWDDLALSRPSFTRMLRPTGVQRLEHLERAKSAGKGVIILTAHFCGCRVAKRYLATIGYPMLSVRDQRAPGDWWGRLGRRILEPRHVEFLESVRGEAVHVHDPGCALKILQRLRSGGLVHIHFDAQPRAGTMEWPFLGVPRRFSTRIFEVIRVSGCAVVPMLCLGRSTGFRIIFGPALEIVDVPRRDEFARANLPVFVETLEKQIREHPAEWEQWTSL